MSDNDIGWASVDEVVGLNLRELRRSRGMSVAEFSAAMREALGAGWARQTVYLYERGERSLGATDLVAAALVLGARVADLLRTDRVVAVGARATAPAELAAAAAGGRIEDEGWSRFEAAADALNDLRTAGARYAMAMGTAQNAVRASGDLRERIERYEGVARASIATHLAAEDAIRRRPGDAPSDDLGRIEQNATPALLAARHALTGTPVDDAEWAWTGVGRG